MKLDRERRRKALLLLHVIKTLLSAGQPVAKRAVGQSASANDKDSILKLLVAEDAAKIALQVTRRFVRALGGSAGIGVAEDVILLTLRTLIHSLLLARGQIGAAKSVREIVAASRAIERVSRQISRFVVMLPEARRKLPAWQAVLRQAATRHARRQRAEMNEGADGQQDNGTERG